MLFLFVKFSNNTKMSESIVDHMGTLTGLNDDGIKSGSGLPTVKITR